LLFISLVRMIGHTNMFDLYNYSLLLIFAAGLGVILGLSEIGWQLGVRAEGKGGSNLATLESAMLGLLALMIAFTFSMALSRFDARRDAVLNEANAISTTALRARLLPEPHRAETLKLLTEYVQIRLDIIRAGTSLAERNAAVVRSNAIQEALWQQAKAMAAKERGLIPTGLFIESLNLMIDDQGKRLAALRSPSPHVRWRVRLAHAGRAVRRLARRQLLLPVQRWLLADAVVWSRLRRGAIRHGALRG